MAAVLMGLLATIIAFMVSRDSELSTFKMQFERDAQTRSQLIIQRVQNNIHDIFSIRSFFDASEQMRLSKFRVFAASLLADRPELKAVAWAPRVLRSDRATWHEMQQKDGRMEVRVSEQTPDGQVVPAGDREICYPITFVEPEKQNDRLVGFDIGSCPIRRSALERACDTGEVAVTERLRLVQTNDSQFGFLVVAPVYQKGKPTTSVEQRRSALQGFVVGGFLAENLLRAAMNVTPPIGVTGDLLDVSAPEEHRLIHHWLSRKPGEETWLTRLIQDPPQYLSEFKCGDRTWGVCMTANHAYINRQYPLRHWLVLLVGLLLTIFLGLYVHTILSHGVRLKDLVELRTAELSTANQELRNEVSQRRSAEEALTQQAGDLQQANDVAVAANRAKSEFLANMSHEIRTPMTAILGFADIILGNSASEETLESAQIIKRNGNHLLTLINDVLDLSKIEAGKCTIDLQKCSPRHLAAEVISLMKVRADAKGLPLTLEVQGDLPERITTDPIRLRQILVNLIGNSIKFTEVGGVRVAMRLDTTPHNDAKLIFDVIDTGVGMSEEQIGLLFRPFSQVDGSASRRFGGTGLGLAISKRMAEMLGGGIVVQSSPGQGSTFSLSIGTGKLDDQSMLNEASKATTPREPVSNAQQKLNCRILLAEDGPDNQRLIAFVLRKAGADVEVAENGQIAFDLAMAARQAGNPFDVILMDIQMPVMDGYEATQKLRSAGYTETIIALTAHAMTGDRQKCMDAGCDDYITKPIDPKYLVERLATWMATASSPV